MCFNEEPDGIHLECAAEIYKLLGERDELLLYLRHLLAGAQVLSEDHVWEIVRDASARRSENAEKKAIRLTVPPGVTHS